LEKAVEKTVSFCGNALTDSEMSLVRQIITEFPSLTQTELASTICELLEWRRPNGKLKTMEALDWLQKWQQRDCLPALPELQGNKPKRPHRLLESSPECDPQPPVRGRLADYQPLQVQLVEGPEDRRLFQQFIQRYHPMGYKVPYGAQLRYLVRGPQPERPVLACLLFTSAAWKMAPRDAWIGWNDEARVANLPRVVNNARFLILPWVEVPHLASHILALAARQLPADWLAAYAVRPLLLETLVDRPHTGTCYRAANWTCVGETQGRGRMDRYNTIKGSHKDILLLPLERRWREHLCQIPEPAPVKKEAEEPVRVEPEVRHPVSRPRIGAYAALVESASVRALPVRPPLRSSAATS
jgi:hypothetical protein